jgi:hypothetical protein
MLTSTLIAAVTWPLMVTENCASNIDADIVGIAKNESGEVVYCELAHQLDSGSLNISYIASGQIFAEKKIFRSTSLSSIDPASTNPSTPSVIQKDFRTGELRQADVSQNNVNLSYQTNSREKIGKAVISMQDVDIVDAGFDNFVRANWDDLQTGKTIAVNFASVAHLKTLPLRVRAQPSEKCFIKQDEHSVLTCFFIEVDNALLRMMIGNIKITYDNQRRLHEFNGIVNLKDDRKKDQKAIIRYFYKHDYLN